MDYLRTCMNTNCVSILQTFGSGDALGEFSIDILTFGHNGQMSLRTGTCKECYFEAIIHHSKYNLTSMFYFDRLNAKPMSVLVKWVTAVCFNCSSAADLVAKFQVLSCYLTSCPS